MSEENEAERILRALVRGGCTGGCLSDRTCRYCRATIGGASDGKHRVDCPFIAGLEFIRRCERRRAG